MRTHHLGGGRRPLEAVPGHVGIENGPLEVNTVVCQCLKLHSHDALHGLGAGVDIAVTVRHDLGLNDGDKALGVADEGVLGKLIGGLTDGKVGGKAVLWVNLETTKTERGKDEPQNKEQRRCSTDL